MFDLGIGMTLLLFVAGVAADALNAVAGGATFFTFPALMLSGLTPLAANATNFVALVPSNIAALPAFRSELKTLGRELIAQLVIGAAGGLVGALALVSLGSELFAALVPYLMGFATVLYATAPNIRAAVERRNGGPAKKGAFFPMLLLFVFSIYGGSVSKRVPQKALRTGVIVFGVLLTIFYFVSNPQ
jgi:uncharacterized membrane protein YfcA